MSTMEDNVQQNEEGCENYYETRQTKTHISKCLSPMIVGVKVTNNMIVCVINKK